MVAFRLEGCLERRLLRQGVDTVRPASAAHVVLYSEPAVTEWSSHHEQGRLAVGHWQRHVPRQGAC